MRFSRIVVVSVFLLAGWAFAAGSAEFFVAPGGDDANPGTKGKPFASLERARDAVRAANAQGPAGATVWLRGGVYERTATFKLDQRDSGTEDAPVVYRAFDNEDVRIMGGRLIPTTAVTAVADEAVRARIVDEAARDKVLRADLAALGITDFGEVRARGFRRPYIPAHMELFINDEAMHLARWPNEGVVPIGEVIDAGSVPRDEDFSNRGGKFKYDFDRPAHWQQADDIWLSGLFGYGFADDTIKVASIDTVSKTITMAQPHMYGIKSGRSFHGYFALNLLEEIDEPGEYVVDRNAGVLYFYPSGNIDGARIAVSMLEEPMVAMEGASHVILRDLSFEVTRGMGVYIERGSGNLVAGCTLRNMGIVAVCIGMGIESDTMYRHEMTGKPVSRALGSWHEHIYENSVFDRQAGTNHGVVGCDISNIGAGGVHLGGGDRKTLTPAGNYVKNCHIHHFNRLGRSYKAGVNIDGVGNRIEHCDIHDCPNNAIYLHGNDHVIEFNEVHHACLDADDMGVFYMGRDPSEQGNVIRHNFWHHNGNDHGSTCVIYFDDDSCGVQVLGNVIYQAKGAGVWINHGCDHVFENNMFVQTNGTVPACVDTRAYDWKTDELQVKRLREDLDITQPPYAQRYPRLLETYEIPMGAGRGSDVFRNVSVNAGDFGTGTNTLKDNLVVTGDPGFVDMAAMDFRLLDESLVFSKIPGFKPIPFDQIGLVVDEYRRSVPVRGKP
jgi:Right handed beta helix region